MIEPTVALAVLSIELGIPVDQLAQRFGTSVTVDAAGCRCVGVDYSRVFAASVRAERQARQEEAQRRRAEAAGQPNVMRERVRALKAMQAPVGTLNEPLRDGQALAAMQAVDGTADGRFATSAERFDELTTGRLTYHRIEKD